MHDELDEAVDEELVFRVVSEVRRRRTRRAAFVGAAALGIAALITAPMLFSSATQQGTDGRTGAADRPKAVPTWTEQRPSGLRWFGEQAEIYAAALNYAVDSASEASPPRPVVNVRVTTCPDVAKRPAGEHCADGAIATDVQRDIAELLPQLRLHFVQDPSSSWEVPLVVFGRISIVGNAATITVQLTCGGRCGQGQTLQLQRTGGQWRVSDAAGPAWIS